MDNVKNTVCVYARACVLYIAKRAKIARNVARFRGSFTGNVNVSLKLHDSLSSIAFFVYFLANLD